MKKNLILIFIIVMLEFISATIYVYNQTSTRLKVGEIEYAIPDTSSSLKGDVSGDGKVTTADYNKVRKHVLYQDLKGEELKRADVNGDGKVNVADYNAIRKIILYRESQDDDSIKGTWILSGMSCKGSYSSVIPFKFTDKMIDDILKVEENLDLTEKIVINNDDNGYLYMNELEYYKITNKNGEFVYKMLDHSGNLISTETVYYTLNSGYLITFRGGCLNRYINSNKVNESDFDYEVPSEYKDINVNSTIEKYHLEKIKDSINNNKELFKKYAYITINNSGISKNKEEVLNLFVVIANNTKMLNENYFLYHLSKLTFKEYSKSYIINTIGNPDTKAFYSQDTISYCKEATKGDLYHELIHFVDDRIGISQFETSNENLTYYTYNNKNYSLKKIQELGLKRFEVEPDSVYLNFIIEGGAEYYSAKYFKNKVGNAYENYFTYIEFFEKLFGEKEMEEIFFSPNTSSILLDYFAEKGTKIDKFIEVIIKMTEVSPSMHGVDFYNNIAEMCKLFNFKWYENDDIYFIVDRSWGHAFDGMTEELLEGVVGWNGGYLKEFLKYYKNTNRVYDKLIGVILQTYGKSNDDVWYYRITLENGDVYIYSNCYNGKDVRYYRAKVDMKKEKIVSVEEEMN